MIKRIRIATVLLLPLLMGLADLPDPTRPPGLLLNSQSSAVAEPLALTAIFIYPKYRVAVINSQAVGIGDHLDEFTVTAITPYTVELTGPSNKKELLQVALPIKQQRD